METTFTLDLAQVARDVNLPVEKVQATVDLLDDGNTVPFITRYRKDQTGGLDEELIRRVRESVDKWRSLADRKQRILKSLAGQSKLTDELSASIAGADSLRRLEDIYQPFKTKKQTLAGLARSRGLEPLAQEILQGSPDAADLRARAEQFVDEEKGLKSVEEVLQGARHLVCEVFNENLELRDELRKILKSTGKLISTRLEESPDTNVSDEKDSAEEAQTTGESAATEKSSETVLMDAASAEGGDEKSTEAAVNTEAELAANVEVEQQSAQKESTAAAEPVAEPVAEAQPPATESEETSEDGTGDGGDSDQKALSQDTMPAESTSESAVPPKAEESASTEPGSPPAEGTAEQEVSGEAANEEGTTAAPQTAAATEEDAAGPVTTEKAESKKKPAKGEKSKRLSVKELAAKNRKESKKRKREKKIESFKDYFKYKESLSKVPPHRLLAINRGDRSKILRVKLEADSKTFTEKAEQWLVREDHPHAEFLRGCVRDSLNRLILPSLDREVRRELTETAEAHAVKVFARNLRKLLLQPPVHGRRVLAVDPGFRSGCKLAALDEFGNVLGHTVIHVIGKEDVVRHGRQQLVEMVKMYHIPVIAIGNGSACRESERLVADVIASELKGQDVQYIIVNEAGASVYSTSAVGRDELPRFDPVLRSAVSIGRRLQDPLSELVKINPANIGVGLYQHDVKSKHLQDSLDAVVESCVNFVGVDVNSASPALLGYVSGLNQLTARRIHEYRQQHGPFRERDDLKKVPGFGDATFIQAAGFLKIVGGGNPLDATWIHPESYEVAKSVIEKLGCTVQDLAARVKVSKMQAASESTMAQFARGVLTTESEKQATEAPATEAPATEAPATEAPATEAPATEADVTPEIPAADETPSEQTIEEVVSVDQTSQAESAPGQVLSAEPQAAQPVSTTTEQGTAVVVAAESSAEQIATPEVELAAESLTERIEKADPLQLAAELGIGGMLLRDILNSLSRPGRDPREDLPPPRFRREIVRLEDLEPGMELSGTVLNVVDFGAFVDMGLHDSGLIHISRLADRFVRDPHEVVSVGDMLTVWVVEVDKQRRRVSLTAIQPGTEKPQPPRREKGESTGKRDDKREGRGRKPGGRRGDARQGGKPQGGKRTQYQQRPQKPKPAKPITKEMAEGKEPMRTFSDLLQFHEKKSKKGDDKKSK